MGQPTTESSAEFSLSTVRREPHSELQTETLSHRGDRTLEAVTVEQHIEDLPKSKKSRAFNLAFVGLGTAVFVFQLDATALGVALPVGPSPCFDQTAPNI